MNGLFKVWFNKTITEHSKLNEMNICWQNSSMQVKFHFSFTSNIKQKVEILHVIHKYPILNYMTHSITAYAMGQQWKQDVIEDEDENKLTTERVMIGWQFISTKW